ncbi:MAG: HlyC/CorC family transporter [Armatimonadetes bacterium]|nr:HlyC/CorC family transporter [Armatimonadota bacterium]
MESTEPPGKRPNGAIARAGAGGAQASGAVFGARNIGEDAVKVARGARPSLRLMWAVVAGAAASYAVGVPAFLESRPTVHARAIAWETIAAVLAMVLIIAFLAAAEVALTTVRRTRLRQLAEEGTRAARPALRLVEAPTQFLATVQIGITLASMFIAAIAARVPAERLAALLAGVAARRDLPWLADHALGVGLALTILAVGLLELLLGELIPKQIALQQAERLSLIVAGPIEALATLTHPLVFVLTRITTLVTRPFGGPGGAPAVSLTEEEIKDIVEESEKEGVLEEAETEMIHSVLEFTDIVVREVMVPRIDMVCVEAGRSLDDLLDVVLASGHTRIPIYEETVDNIVGTVHAKDLLRVVRDGVREVGIRQANVLRPVYYVPENMKVDDLLAEFQRRQHQMAIVVDEYGGTAGLITLEDLLEEIVGPITDEYDVENEPTVSIMDDDVALADARMALDDVNEILGLRLSEEDSETLGGYVFSLLGKIPTVGETVDQDGLRFEVTEADSRRITRVKITRLREESEEPTGGDPADAV